MEQTLEKVQLFAKLRQLRSLQKELFPQLRTVLDHDIVVEIGYHEESELPLAWSHLILQGLGAPATVNRRMARLHRLGVIEKITSRLDGRVVQLRLSAQTREAYQRYAAAIAMRDAAAHGAPRADANMLAATSQLAMDDTRADEAGAAFANRPHR